MACLLSVFSLLTIAIPQAHASAVTCIWAHSGGGDDNFSNMANWQDCNGGAPTGNGSEELEFPIDPGTILTANNNLSAGASFTDIKFTDGASGDNGYVITGNAINVGDITDQSTTATGNELELNLTLIGSSQVTFAGSSSSQLIIGDPNNIGANTLDLASSNPFQVSNTTIASSLTGSGTLNTAGADGDGGVDLLADSPNFTGTINGNASTLSLDSASAAGIVVNSGSTLKGDGGSAPSITVNSGGTVAPGHSPGCLTANSQLVINGTYQAEIAGTTACSDYDQITSAGSTDVTSATLNVSFLNGFQPSVGDSFIIIKNTGGGAVTGTFAGLPEGGTFKVDNVTFAITYQGNGENDVVLTVAAVDAASAASSAPNTPDTGLAAIAARPGTVLAVTVLSASTLLAIARRLRMAR